MSVLEREPVKSSISIVPALARRIKSAEWLPTVRFRERYQPVRSGRRFSVALYTSATLFAILVLMVPLYLIVRAGTAWEAAWQTITRPATLSVIRNTLLLTVSVTASATAIAVPLAWLTTRTDLPGRKWWSVVHALPLVIPSYIYAFLFLSFLSPKGLLQQVLNWLIGVDQLPNVYGFYGAFAVLTLISYPYIYLPVQAALRVMEPTLLEAAQVDGASKRQVLRHVLVPYLTPSIGAGGVLVALYVLRDFGAVTLLQYSTFTRVIYNRYQGFRLDEAATLALLLVVITCVILFAESRWRSDETETTNEVAEDGQFKLFALKRWTAPALLFTFGIAFFALLMPIGVLGYWVVRGMRQDWVVAELSAAGQNMGQLSELILPAGLSVLTALLAALLAVLLGLPVAILATRFRGKRAAFFERVSYASYALPGIVVALAFVYIGINFARPLYQTIPLLLAAYMVIFAPQAIGAERSALARIPEELEEAGYSMGGGHLAILRYVTLPLMRPGLVTAGLLVFLTVMKELPATLILSPIGFRTLPVLVWSNISEAFFARAALPTLLLLLLSSVPLAWHSLRSNRSS